MDELAEARRRQAAGEFLTQRQERLLAEAGADETLTETAIRLREQILTVVNLEWVTVDQPSYLGPGMRYQVYESAPYETWERGGQPFATLAEVAVFLREQAAVHHKVALQYIEAAQIVEAKG